MPEQIKPAPVASRVDTLRILETLDPRKDVPPDCVPVFVWCEGRLGVGMHFQGEWYTTTIMRPDEGKFKSRPEARWTLKIPDRWMYPPAELVNK